MTAITAPAPRIATATAKPHSFFNKPARRPLVRQPGPCPNGDSAGSSRKSAGTAG
jgi:hypothetical protein